MPVMRYRRPSAVKLNRRVSVGTVKPGNYGISPRNISFAPNVTPVTYTAPEDEPFPADDPYASNIFPPSESPAPPPARKRCPPGKRRSQGYIPRPPNAFMLFRADFVRQKHVPGSIETNHGSLSKIIGNCWRALPLEEKRIWEVRARQEKAAHKLLYPDYRFRPVHNKNKDKKGLKEKVPSTQEDERRCEEVAQLLLEGKKGEELAMAVRILDRDRERSPTVPLTPDDDDDQIAMPVPMHFPPPPMSNNNLYLRRPSSVPLPGDFFLQPFLQPQAVNPMALSQPAFLSRPASPVGTISRQAQAQQQQQQRSFLGHRRASSAQPVLRRSWTLPSHWGIPADEPYQPHHTTMDMGMMYDMSMGGFYGNLPLQSDPSPLPDVDSSLFNDGFSFGNGNGGGGVEESTHVATPVETRVPSREGSIMGGSLHLDLSVDPLWNTGANSNISASVLDPLSSASSSSSSCPSPGAPTTGSGTLEANALLNQPFLHGQDDGKYLQLHHQQEMLQQHHQHQQQQQQQQWMQGYGGGPVDFNLGAWGDEGVVGLQLQEGVEGEFGYM